MDDEESLRFERDLRGFRESLFDLDALDLPAVRTQRRRVERQLRKVMSRTERLAVKSDRNGMLVEVPIQGIGLASADHRAYLAADAVGRRLASGDVVEYWKSAPYLLNFMESYKIKRSFKEAVRGPKARADLAQILAAGDGLLSLPDIEAYLPIDPSNARMRALIRDTLDEETWRLLWLPPSLPYHQLGAPFDRERHAHFTKRLVFSAWWVVPQVIATLLSYEADRRMIRAGGRRWRNTPVARERVRPLLRFQRQAQRVAGMPLFALIYPSPTLAKLADPLQIGGQLGAGERPPSLAEVTAVAEDRISSAIRAVVPSNTPKDGPVDERWYWVAPVLLDARDNRLRNAEWLGRTGAASAWRPEAEADVSALGDALAYAIETSVDARTLGRVPTDLPTVLARLAVAAPANCGLRALARAAGSIDLVGDSGLRDGAARIGWGFRSLFNVPEVMALLRGGRGEDEAYWQKVLDYCLNGCLQAVLDEYVHVLREWLGIIDRDISVLGLELSKTIYDALAIRAVNYHVEDIRVGGPGAVTVEPKNMRARFALRFGSQGAEEDGALQRAGQVRAAFNSPFWPFVLATTSVGQEGLDFHLYCHAVVHWNLPANPVDLEQREGRVHRYKGHAIRKNVASANRLAAFNRRGRDPWDELFAAARVGRNRQEGDLVPYWVYAPTEGSARIERYVPSFPLSREIDQLKQLKRSLAVYRLAFGQPRQDDLTAYLSDLSEEKRREVSAAIRIDLAP